MPVLLDILPPDECTRVRAVGHINANELVPDVAVRVCNHMLAAASESVCVGGPRLSDPVISLAIIFTQTYIFTGTNDYTEINIFTKTN